MYLYIQAHNFHETRKNRFLTRNSINNCIQFNIMAINVISISVFVFEARKFNLSSIAMCNEMKKTQDDFEFNY